MPYREIARAWEAFHQDGIASSVVRPAVLASWQRSRQHAITASRSEAPLVSEAELHRRRQQNTRLIAAARPAMDEARHLLSDARSMLILTDTEGTILETEGDARAVDTGQEVKLQRGGLWCEAQIGTNAIGTALACGRPVQIHAAEHFCASVQRWTCAAAPVRHPGHGAVIGAVDVSGSTDTFNPQNLAHAVALAQQIEAVLGRRMEMEHEQVLRHFLSKRSLWLSEEILAFGRSGALIYSTDRALKEVIRRNAHFIADGRLAALNDVAPAAWAERVAALLPGASVEIVREDGEEIGGVVVLHAPRKPRPVMREATREPEVLPFETIIGDSPVMREVREKARRMAESGLPILLEGETGVGKEVFARAIHGGRAPCGPFVPLNCGGLPRDLIASELFGYEKGAFTGADTAGKQGKVEAADGGLLCLDEIGEMPLELQSYLLRVLEDGVVYRVGGHTGRRVNLRLVSMTNRDLSGEVAAGRFRKDLFYRIAALRLRIPPLRERGADVALLLDHFGRSASARAGLPPPRFSPAAHAALMAYGWPGNVRELRNVVDMLVAMGGTGCDADALIDIADLPQEIREETTGTARATDLKAVEEAAIRAAVDACGGNLSRAARRLGIARSTLYMRLSALER
ncbi:GAF modulated sigma54 specific transcriptional regulator, Fis family [Xanthobacter versatilis]|uniref:GAF modulated sigma54 specific transcriptional regulator, Fis family n=1 Tax=Xanthobacter autotrophicus (strain ATCC BAA-1158 / Py2) TaxID=78245 RepID=Q8RM05_XANP2|nr:sigma-54 dependent transcriptional activator [Xanthobacter autotrophicus Py2]ABS68737.1 GAF modulated sigma54 specific transcriptional regulator, Fis family [Xanthobacter autotrophicus Py2]